MLEIIKKFFSIYLVIPTIFFAGIYFSVILKFIQFRNIFQAIKYTIATSYAKQKFSSFSALTAVLGGNLGTGNIAGIAVALKVGGPGSLFWMIIMILLGTVIKFCCCFLGVKYREKDQDQQWVGGPMFYLAKGLHCKYLAKLFCVLLLCSAITTGNFIQVHSITLPLHQAQVSPFLVASIIACLIGGIMLGGVKRFAQLVTALVPFMAIFYIIACVIILINYRTTIGSNIMLIWHNAFGTQAISGATIGVGILQAMRVGFDRGIMATDTGIGIAPILHAKVDLKGNYSLTNLANQQGLISMLAPIIVLFICLLTGLVLLVTNAWMLPLESTKMCLSAFATGLNSNFLAVIVVNVTLCLFAFTTILTWGYCAETAVGYLTANYKNRNKINILFKCLFVLLIPCGVWFEVKFLWNLADLCLNIMLLTNMYGVFRLAKYIIKDLSNN